ncbi:MAG: glycosyltransferase, partial [Muribaculaceae bacterium]|nr:glycosyltransferase [Muribaculaceae bacterium]
MTPRPDTPLISVIVPAHNCGRYLEECVGSIRNQTYQNWELIIVDDSSTDGTAEIAESLATNDSRITTFHIKVHDVS